MSCQCIALINDAFALEGSNTVLDVPIEISIKTGEVKEPKVAISTSKRDPKNRKRPALMIPIFCPFCGVRYEDRP